jgi:hypothetical protein
MKDHSCDVFISYNHKDARFVEFLVSSLERVGLSCFQDVARLKMFDKLDASLKSAIAGSRWLIAVISPNYLRSYWCLFEAIEAIQGQDVEVRFLPILVRASPTEQSLDEESVLEALDDLDKVMKELEQRIIRSRAYELSAKLDKLTFVRQNLPRVFRQIQERIFPEFRLWDDKSVSQTMRQVLDRLTPNADTAQAWNAEIPLLLPRGRSGRLTLPADATPEDLDALRESLKFTLRELPAHLGHEEGHKSPLVREGSKTSPAKSTRNIRAK